MTLRGHTDIVNAVKFLPTEYGQSEIILSGSADRTIRVWRLPPHKAPPEFITVLEGHDKSVNCLAVIPGLKIFVSGAADGTVKVWRFSFREERLDVEDLQTIFLSPKCFPLTLALHALDSTSAGGLILAAAGTRNTIQIFVSDEHARFSHQVHLTGHDGWIRSLAFCRESISPSSDLLLASASQDKYIRLWRISQDKSTAASGQADALGGFDPSLSNKTYRLLTPATNHTITFEALLLGHDDWIYTVTWRLKQDRLQLLSASEDNSLATWEREETSGLWVPTTRLGEISSLKGSTTATGSAGGFWIGLWGPKGKGEQLASLGRTGSWRLWTYDESQKAWQAGIGISGHTRPVTDIAWSRNGSYLLSTGSDQTTRLHAEWKRGSKRSWHEIARPQIHGYDLNCIDSIGESYFISGADEKLLRVFDEPRATANLLEVLSGVRTDPRDALPETADIPVLGLSNKAINTEANEEPVGDDAEYLEEEDGMSVRSFVRNEKASMPGQPPTEDLLARHTLWPEREKLYGHGHEISAVAVNPQGNVIATACKASSQDHAVIRLFTTRYWREIKPPLTAHSLTVTSLCFSESGCYLLSVGRDRMWAVWEVNLKTNDPQKVAMEGSFRLKCTNPKGHSRMILNADWASNAVADGKAFATAGRDKCAKIWFIKGSDTVDCVATIIESAAVTAVAIAPRPVGSCMLIALGTETGRVSLHLLNCFDWSYYPTQELDLS